MAGFPNGPTLGDIYTLQAASWRWDGTAWKAYAISSGITGPQGDQGNSGNTGPTGPTGAIPTNYVESIRGLTGIVGVSAGKGITIGVSGKTLTITSTLQLSQLEDTAISSGSLQDGQALVYNNSTKLWTNKRGSLNDLSNTNIQGAQQGQALFYDGTNWENEFPTNNFTYGNTYPVGPTAGDLWFHSVDGRMYFYLNDGNSTQWVEIPYR